MSKSTQKIYCYADETGQDARSEFFVVVCVIITNEPDVLKVKLNSLERHSKIGVKKWHSSRSPEREAFLELLIKHEILKGSVYYGKFKKRLPFFLPMLKVIEKSIKDKIVNKNYRAIVYVDGIDKKKAGELTKCLRSTGLSIEYVRSARDESEPLIRLADRWSGCIRASLEGSLKNHKILLLAENNNYIKCL